MSIEGSHVKKKDIGDKEDEDSRVKMESLQRSCWNLVLTVYCLSSCLGSVLLIFFCVMLYIYLYASP